MVQVLLYPLCKFGTGINLMFELLRLHECAGPFPQFFKD